MEEDNKNEKQELDRSSSSASLSSKDIKKEKKSKKKKSKKSKSARKIQENSSDVVASSTESFDVRSTLTPDQLESLELISKNILEDSELLPFSKYERRWLSDMCFCRFLRARDYDVKKSTEMLKNSIKWRREYKPHKITAEDVYSEMDNPGKMYRGGKDKEGRPILYMKPAFDNTGPEVKEKKVKYLVYLMEKAARATDESKGVEKFVWFVDFKNYSGLVSIGMTKISKEILDILQDHYPERLGVAYMLNAPWVFGMFLKFLSPFLTETTKNKLKLIKSSEMDSILEGINPDQLEKEYGGTVEHVYSYETQKDKEDREYPPILDEENI